MQDLRVVSDWPTTNILVAMGSSFQKRSKIISNFWRRCYTVLSLENLALQHPTETPPSFLSLQQWLQQESYTRNRLPYTFHTHHPLGLSIPCDFCPVSASKLSKTRRSSACSSCQFDSFDFKDTLTAYIYSSILTTASSEHYIIKGSLAEKLPIYKQDRRVE